MARGSGSRLGFSRRRRGTQLNLVILLIAISVVSLLSTSVTLAHQPNIVGRRTLIMVNEPEVSKAYYGELTGRPALYEIRSDVPFKLYVGLLVPDLQGISTGLRAEITRDGEPLTTLDGATFTWTKFHEPYGGDDYLQGPEYRGDVGPGTYRIRVGNPDKQGKYVLAVGEIEKFPPKVILRTLLDLPKLKKDFFEKSPWSALTGRFVLPVVVAVLVIIAVITALLLR